jgi:tRNA modification GTPase
MAAGGEADIIAAVATAPGRGAIGIVRVSGRDLRPFAKELLGSVPKARTAVRSIYRESTGAAIDEGISIFFPAPASYTGEDVLELQGHGGSVVLHMLLRRCRELGARLAEPGEFTRRGFLNDKLDLAQAEGVADLIEAATETAARCALRSLSGEFSSLIEDIKRKLVELRAWVEASLDFGDEEIELLDRRGVRERLEGLRGQVTKLLERGRQGSVLRSGLRVVLAGQPNVGKSSLLNKLAGEELAIVTEIPGTTRDSVRQAVQIEGIPMNIIDTAGLRSTKDAVEAIGIARTWEALGDADVAVLVADARAGLSGADEDIARQFPRGLRKVTVLNKIDLSGHPAGSVEQGRDWRVYLSAKTGEGVDGLRQVLLQLAGWRSGGEDVFMARERHLVSLARVCEALGRAEEAGTKEEILAEELRLAQRELDAVTGEVSADDLLGEIFARFCIGK